MSLKFTLLIFTLLPCFLFAQRVVHIEGQATNYKGNGNMYFETPVGLLPVAISDDGYFFLDVEFPALPAYVSISTISPKGKITNLTPYLWFEGDSVVINADFSGNSFAMLPTTSYQKISDDINAAKGADRIKKILAQPTQIPAIFFADKEKENISKAQLETFIAQIPAEHRTLMYAKRVEKYVEAQSRPSLKKGVTVQSFTLPKRKGGDFTVGPKSGNHQLIALVSSGCSYSLASISLLEQIAQTETKNLDLVTIWADPSEKTWLYASQKVKEKIVWIDLWDEFGFADEYFKVKLSPTFLVLDEKGVVVDRFNGYNKKSVKRMKYWMNAG